MKPILFNTEMVKAILDGRKTQTRRAIKEIPTRIHYGKPIMEWGLSIVHSEDFNGEKLAFEVQTDVDDSRIEHAVPQYKVGDIIYVRETFSEWLDYDTKSLSRVTYKASDEDCSGKWKPSIHMPKEYARIFLKVTSVRVERLQDITWDDAKAEGIEKVYDYSDIHPEIGMPASDYVTPFKTLWNSTSKDGYKWEDNPYVFVYDFERVDNDIE